MPHRPPGKLKKYVCYTVWSNPSIFLSSTSPSSLDPTGTSLYPLTHCISYDKFSLSYRGFVVVVNVGIEPTKYSKAASVLEWRLL